MIRWAVMFLSLVVFTLGCPRKSDVPKTVVDGHAYLDDRYVPGALITLSAVDWAEKTPQIKPNANGEFNAQIRGGGMYTAALVWKGKVYRLDTGFEPGFQVGTGPKEPLYLRFYSQERPHGGGQ